MMKKLLVLALVLSMATLANATLTMTISGPTEVLTDSVTTYTVSYSGESILSSDNDITATLGSIDGGVIITTNRDTVLDVIQISPVAGNYQIAITNDILATDMGSPLFTFDFTAPSVTGLVTLSLLDNGATCNLVWEVISGAEGRLVVNVIPEPMTMGLLGLGGLFLRRRSK